MSKSTLLRFFTSKIIVLTVAFIVLTVGYIVWQWHDNGIGKLLGSNQAVIESGEKGSQYQLFSQIRVDPDINFFEDEANPKSVETIPSFSPSPSTDQSSAMAQNHTDVQNVYFNYLKYSQAILLIQVRLTTIATFKSNRSELLVELEKLATQQASLSSEIEAFTIPKSLQSYTAIEQAVGTLVVANSDLEIATTQLVTYLHTGSKHAELVAQEHLNQATEKILQSADTFSAVTEELPVELQQFSQGKE